MKILSKCGQLESPTAAVVVAVVAAAPCRQGEVCPEIQKTIIMNM
jgi:hypothetical protein